VLVKGTPAAGPGGELCLPCICRCMRLSFVPCTSRAIHALDSLRFFDWLAVCMAAARSCACEQGCAVIGHCAGLSAKACMETDSPALSTVDCHTGLRPLPCAGVPRVNRCLPWPAGNRACIPVASASLLPACIPVACLHPCRLHPC
jgi:hypothetical protein